jgi:RNA polymerase sigma-70 factor (ECF subfamily)
VDETGFEELVRAHERLVFGLARGVLGDPAEAEDVAQDVFLRAYRKLEGLRDRQKFRAWVARMSIRLALNRRRGLRRAHLRDAEWLRGAPPAVEPASDLALRQAIARLPYKLRSVLLLCAVEGMDAAEVARILRVPDGTVRSRLHLARKQLLLEVGR